MTKYLVHVTITAEVEVDVHVDSQDTGVQKHVAARAAKEGVGHILEDVNLTVTGIATGTVWPTEPHTLHGEFMAGARDWKSTNTEIGPDPFFNEPPEIVEAEIIE